MKRFSSLPLTGSFDRVEANRTITLDTRCVGQATKHTNPMSTQTWKKPLAAATQKLKLMCFTFDFVHYALEMLRFQIESAKSELAHRTPTQISTRNTRAGRISTARTRSCACVCVCVRLCCIVYNEHYLELLLLFLRFFSSLVPARLAKTISFLFLFILLFC